MTLPRLLDAGECALVAEFGSVIDDESSARVLALDAALTGERPDGVLETVPTYRSLMIHYDPLVISRDDLARCVAGAAAGWQPSGAAGGAVWSVPACYETFAAEDLGQVAAAVGLTEDGVARCHQSAGYTLVMYGFAPGWAYLSGLPEALALPRRPTPRPVIPAGSLIVAGGQAIIAALPMPSGWHIIGRTPVRMFMPERERPFLFAPGDRVRFSPVDAEAFAELSARAEAGETVAERIG